jgi:putative phosphoesterase
VAVKIIALGDIHGNLPALEVALREARAEGYDVLLHTGDLVGFAPFPDETVERIRTERIAGVRGDIDDAIAADREETTGCADDEPGRIFEEKAYQWTRARVSHGAIRYLDNLPFERRLDVGGRRAVVVHSTPIDAVTCLTEDRDEDFFREMGEVSDADLILFGHTHRGYHRIVDGRHFINAGSVGYPQDGDPRTGYTVILTNGNVEVQVRRFPYDTGRLMTVAASRRFPPEAARRFKA